MTEHYNIMPFVKTGIATSLGEVKIKQAESEEVKDSEKKPETTTKEDK